MPGSKSEELLRLPLWALCLCLAAPALVDAAQNKADASDKAADVNGTRTVEFNSRGQFACGEIVPDRSGGFLRYEISFNPRTIERCELEKVGSRLHDCERFNINVVTTNVHQINTVYTDGGIVQFWFEDNARIDTADKPGALIFLWPGTDSRFVCLPFQ